MGGATNGPPEALTSGQVARRAGIGVEVLRFYERRGLVPEPPRSGSSYRQYPRATVDRIRFIRRSREIGFSLDEIGDLTACPSCDVHVLDMKEAAVADRARTLGVRSVPAIAVNGELAGCCAERGPDPDTLRAAGLGQPID